jgi:hypothetical protein
MSTSSSAAARWWSSSAPTAPARARSSRRSPGWSRPSRRLDHARQPRTVAAAAA